MKPIHPYLDKLLNEVVQQQASDLHITVGRHPTLRVDRSLIPLLKQEVVTDELSREMVLSLLDENQQARFLEINLFYQRGYIGAAMRRIPASVATIEDLNLPLILRDFAAQKQGFFLVVGPTGHGKSTALASMVDHINHVRSEHIVTIEDPIEYLFASDRSILDQREVGIDTHDFSIALKSMFREDADVVMVGEMRDAETIQAAVTAAETGHLILSTLHTNNAAQTIDRIIDAFPAAQQRQIRSQLAMTLIGIVSLRLLPRASGGLIPAAEILVANTAIRNLIRESKAQEIDMVIETSYEDGMVSLNRSLMGLVHGGEVTLEEAMKFSHSPGDLEAMLKT
jgi:twitching motility protein PilT